MRSGHEIFLRAPDGKQSGHSINTSPNLRPARKGDLPSQDFNPEFVAPVSEAARTVDTMRRAIALVGEEKHQSSKEDIAALLPYYSGTKSLPSPDTTEGRSLRHEISLNRQGLEAVQLAAYKKWLKDNPSLAKSSEKTGDAWNAAVKAGDENAKEILRKTAEYGALTLVGSTFTPHGKNPDNLPHIPEVLRLILHEDEMLAHKARNAFSVALNGMGFKNNDAGKLCEVFAHIFKERDRSHIDAHDSGMRDQFDHAALALLSYKIVYPTVQKREPRNGVATEQVGFAVNFKLLERHAEVFLALKREERLTIQIKDEKDPVRKASLSAELESLQPDIQDAKTFLENLKSKHGLSVREPATIFETFGNRMYVKGSDLPVFSAPQPADTSKGRSVASRSLDAALRVLKDRDQESETRFHSQDLVVRQAEFSHTLQFAAASLREFEDAKALFFESDSDEESLLVARYVLKQIIDKANEVRMVRVATVKTLTQSGKSEQSMAERTTKFQPLLTLADTLLKKYEDLLSDFGQKLFSKNESGNVQTTQTEELSTLRQNFADAVEEIRQNRDFLPIVRELLSTGTPSVEVIAFIDEYLSHSSNADEVTS